MKTGTILAIVSAIALAAGGYHYLQRGGYISSPPIMTPAGETTLDGWVFKRETVDYETIIKSAIAQKASFLTMTLEQDIVRDQHLKESIKYTPFPASRARVRVKYHVQYPIGYVLSPGRFQVKGDENGLVLTLPRPQLIASPSVKLLSYEILDKGILIDEKTAVIKLQERIQPEAEKRAAQILKRRDVVPRSEKALRGFLEPILAKSGKGTSPPITFKYR